MLTFIFVALQAVGPDAKAWEDPVQFKGSVLRLARHFAITKPEPGPYCVVKVWRDASFVAEPDVALR